MRFSGYLVVSACLLSGILAEAGTDNVPGPNKSSIDPLKSVGVAQNKASVGISSGSTANNLSQPKPAVDPPNPVEAKPSTGFGRASGGGGSGSIAASVLRTTPVTGIAQPLWAYEKAEDFIKDFSLASPEKQLDSVNHLFEIRGELGKLQDGIRSKIEELKDNKDDKIVKLREYLNNLLNPSPKPESTPYVPLTKPGEQRSVENPSSLAGR